MNEWLKALHDTFYEKQPAASLKAEVEECHQKLIERLGRLFAAFQEPCLWPLLPLLPVRKWYMAMSSIGSFL